MAVDGGGEGDVAMELEHQEDGEIESVTRPSSGGGSYLWRTSNFDPHHWEECELWDNDVSIHTTDGSDMSNMFLLIWS
jgi:hypothetical protein